MTHTAFDDPGKLIYSRERSFFPLPGALIAGLFIAGISTICWCVVLFAGDDSFQRDPIPVGVVLSLLPFGLFVSVLGYRQQPVFRFYDAGFQVTGPEQRFVQYKDVTHVEVFRVHMTLDHILPIGTVYSLNITCLDADRNPKTYACQIQRASGQSVELDRVAAYIQGHVDENKP